MQIFFIVLSLLFVFFPASAVMASHTFTVTGFDGTQNFLWSNGPPHGCSAINSYVMTYPGNDQQSKLFVCEETFAQSEGIIPDGDYYITLAVSEHLWKSQVFTIRDGAFEQIVPTATPTSIPTPTPAIINQTPAAVAGTSLDMNGNLQLDGSLSSDSEGDPLTYAWIIAGQSNVRTGKVASIADLPTGKFNVTLRVSDPYSMSTDKTSLGITGKRTQSTINMKIKKVEIDKKNGSFTLKGDFDEKNTLFKQILTNPISRVLFELQTGGTDKMPIYGLVGESIQKIDYRGKN